MAMTCPWCGKEMAPGRLTAGGFSVRWVPKGGHDLLDKVKISRFSLSPKGAPAYACRTCRKVIADY